MRGGRLEANGEESHGGIGCSWGIEKNFKYRPLASAYPDVLYGTLRWTPKTGQVVKLQSGS